ncbi:MAG: LLM class flavin-dependent oxidoreductase [Solirubrobacteraceae bacterium]
MPRYEELGFDFVAKGDHVGGLGPFPLLTAAAAVSERLRLRTYVLNTSFWNPTLLARDAATLDRLSGGRLELGLGAETVRREFDAASVPWEAAGVRIQRMSDTLVRLRECSDLVITSHGRCRMRFRCSLGRCHAVAWQSPPSTPTSSGSPGCATSPDNQPGR